MLCKQSQKMLEEFNAGTTSKIATWSGVINEIMGGATSIATYGAAFAVLIFTLSF